MNALRRTLLLTFLLLIALGGSALAQTRAHATASTDPLTMLPASDVVIVIDHSRIWNEAIPRIFGTNFAPLAKLKAELDQIKAKVGVDVRSISRIVAGVRFKQPEGVTPNMDKKDFGLVIILAGDFDAMKFVDFMRREEKDKVREIQHGGQIIYSVDEGPKNNRPRADTEKPSLAVLEAGTFALGDLEQVRATIDAKNGTGQLSPDLLTLVMRNSNSLISIAGNVPPSLTASLAPKGKSGSEDLDQTVNKFFEAVAAIKQMHVSLGLTATGVEALIAARFTSTEQAQSLGDMLLGARQQYGVFIEDKTIRDLVEQIQITAPGDEVQLRVEVPQTLITVMLGKAEKEKAATSSAPAAKTTTTAKTTAPQPKKKTRRSTRRKKS